MNTSTDPGARVVRGEIHRRWAELGWERSPLGYPLTDELGTPDGRGRFNHFEGGSVYWSPASGGHVGYPQIRDRWAALGWETGLLGYPVSHPRAAHRSRICGYTTCPPLAGDQYTEPPSKWLKRPRPSGVPSSSVNG